MMVEGIASFVVAHERGLSASMEPLRLSWLQGGQAQRIRHGPASVMACPVSPRSSLACRSGLTLANLAALVWSRKGGQGVIAQAPSTLRRFGQTDRFDRQAGGRHLGGHQAIIRHGDRLPIGVEPRVIR